MKINSFEELFVCLLSDIYIVEKILVKDLPHLIKKAYSDDLKDSLKEHFGETKEQVKRLEKIFHIINQRPMDVTWSNDIKSLFVDTESFLEENESSPLLDVAIIALAQRVEHFEITTYGTLKAFADALDYDDVKSILKETLKEEGHADKILSDLAEGGLLTEGINIKAAK